MGPTNCKLTVVTISMYRHVLGEYCTVQVCWMDMANLHLLAKPVQLLPDLVVASDGLFILHHYRVSLPLQSPHP